MLGSGRGGFHFTLFPALIPLPLPLPPLHPPPVLPALSVVVFAAVEPLCKCVRVRFDTSALLYPDNVLVDGSDDPGTGGDAVAEVAAVDEGVGVECVMKFTPSC